MKHENVIFSGFLKSTQIEILKNKETTFFA
jgi:hypothetical protein